MVYHGYGVLLCGFVQLCDPVVCGEQGLMWSCFEMCLCGMVQHGLKGCQRLKLFLPHENPCAPSKKSN